MRYRWLILALGTFFLAGPAAALQPEYDIVIRNGRVLDGAGNPWVKADVAITDGVFVRIGEVREQGRREIDASGLYVSPGWIDMMDQSGAMLLVNGRAENKLLMGVTTAIAGEGGTPVAADQIGAYLTSLEKKGISLNFGTYYATHQARKAVMGDKAGAPTKAQMASMKALVAEAMEQGALGVATALIYPPASFQSSDNLAELAGVAARYGGSYASHMRDESGGLLDAIRESIRIGQRSGARVEIFHLKAAYAPGWGKLMVEAGKLIGDARTRGVDIAADVYPYTAGGTGLSVTVPNWIFEDGVEAGMKRLQDPQIRNRVKKEVQAGSQPGWSNLVEAAGGWENIVLANAHAPQFSKYEGRSIADIAAELQRDPTDIALDIVVAAFPQRAMALFHLMSEKDVAMALSYPWSSVGSDSGAVEQLGGVPGEGLAHPRAYGTFPRIYAEYVRKQGVLTLPEAVRKMTSWPASRMGLERRGLIRTGMHADVTLFDLDRIADRATYDEPSLLPVGIPYVIVNGTIVVDEGRHTGATPGRSLRGPGAN